MVVLGLDVFGFGLVVEVLGFGCALATLITIVTTIKNNSFFILKKGWLFNNLIMTQPDNL